MATLLEALKKSREGSTAGGDGDKKNPAKSQSSSKGKYSIDN
mgnify:CR=1 FL=1